MDEIPATNVARTRAILAIAVAATCLYLAYAYRQFLDARLQAEHDFQERLRLELRDFAEHAHDVYGGHLAALAGRNGHVEAAEELAPEPVVAAPVRPDPIAETSPELHAVVDNDRPIDPSPPAPPVVEDEPPAA